MVDGRDADQGGDLFFADQPEFGKLGDQRRCRDGADTWDGAEEFGATDQCLIGIDCACDGVVRLDIGMVLAAMPRTNPRVYTPVASHTSCGRSRRATRRTGSTRP